MGSNEQQLFGCCVRKVEPLYEKASFMNDNGNICVLNRYLNNIYIFFLKNWKMKIEQRLLVENNQILFVTQHFTIQNIVF